MKKLTANLLCLYMASTGAAYCQLITFDDLSVLGVFSVIPNGYQGLNWDNFYVLNTVADQAQLGVNGAVNGVVSPPNIAFNGLGNPASISAATPFTLDSGYFTAVWNNGLTLEVIGLNGAATEYDNTYTLNTSGPMLIDFSDASVTEVEFESSGGVPAGYSFGTGTQFALDNLTVATVPEPSTGLMFGIGVGVLGWLRRKE